jgi:glycosyltransferase involved in cell wall biosynthesis
MKILLWHGYLLTGSGSNIYTANIAREWRKTGHDVLLMCQERSVEGLDFVDASADFDATNRRFEMRPTGAPPAAGRLRLLRPNTGGLLPVYVYDEYEGFTVKRFVDLTDDELDFYTSANIQAMVSAIEEHQPDALITGHEVMGPYVALQACEATGKEYLTKLHGSALEYAVKVQDRYKRFAREGLLGAAVVTGGSRYMIKEASSVVPGWEHKAVVVNPGCDVELFKPIDRTGARSFVVGYVGKFLVQKGVHNLLASLGLTRANGLRAVIVGYGELEPTLHSIWEAIQSRDVDKLLSIAAGTSGLDHLVDFLKHDVVGDAYFERAKEIPLEFTGRLDHGPLAKVLPTFDVLVVPSVLAEAFGMVAAEAAACGVLPIVPAHSGIGEVGAAVEEAIQRPGLLTFDPGDPIAGIASQIDAVARLSVEERSGLGRIAVDLAHERWSWAHVAETLLSHAQGR